jgi:two-component system cell cycle response regulator DivK
MFDPPGISTSVSPVQASRSGGTTAEPVGTNRPIVLLVDDDLDSLVLLSYILESFPCHVSCESNGAVALERLCRERFDLVMLDIQLPEINGLDIVRAVRSNPMNAVLPIVAVTALARAQDRAEILQAGCDCYISKPYLVEDVESLVARYIKKQP